MNIIMAYPPSFSVTKKNALSSNFLTALNNRGTTPVTTVAIKGAGKTQLMALFATGAAIPIAIEL